MKETIKKYAHDYRDMKMSQEELEKLLLNITEELMKEFKEVIEEEYAKSNKNYEEAISLAGINSCGACNADGEKDAYLIVLDLLK